MGKPRIERVNSGLGGKVEIAVRDGEMRRSLRLHRCGNRRNRNSERQEQLFHGHFLLGFDDKEMQLSVATFQQKSGHETQVRLMISFMQRMPPFAAVRVFEAAARHENYTRAAEELGMTQAGVSYQIKLLEDRLGEPLFMRKGRGRVLTAAGRRIAPRLTEAFGEIEAAFASLRTESDAVLRVSAPHTLATNWLAGKLGGFQIARPGLAVQLDVSDRFVDLEGGEFDLAIRGTADPGTGLVTHFLMRQVFLPMASPEFLARHPVAEPADLAAAPRLSPNDIWWDLWFAKIEHGGTIPAGRPAIRFDSQVLDGQAALAGHGVAVLNPVMFESAIAAGRLVPLFPCAATEARAFWLCYPEHKRRSPKVRAFRDWLLGEVRASAGEDDRWGLLQPPEAGAPVGAC
jgi:LysR family glycine cleavage system transcriptional activator